MVFKELFIVFAYTEDVFPPRWAVQACISTKLRVQVPTDETTLRVFGQILRRTLSTSGLAYVRSTLGSAVNRQTSHV